MTGSTSCGATTITQGKGINDSASVSTSSAGGVSITQNDQAGNVGDTALIMSDTVNGSATIVQGAANGEYRRLTRRRSVATSPSPRASAAVIPPL